MRLNSLEITPPSNSNYSRDSTERMRNAIVRD